MEKRDVVPFILYAIGLVIIAIKFDSLTIIAVSLIFFAGQIRVSNLMRRVVDVFFNGLQLTSKMKHVEEKIDELNINRQNH